MELKSPQYPFGLKPLLEFSLSFFSQSITAFRVRSIQGLLYLKDTEVSQLKGQATMMPFWASCFVYSGAQVWNSLPFRIKEARSFDIFRKTLKEHIFTVEEI